MLLVECMKSGWGLYSHAPHHVQVRLVNLTSVLCPTAEGHPLFYT